MNEERRQELIARMGNEIVNTERPLESLAQKAERIEAANRAASPSDTETLRAATVTQATAQKISVPRSETCPLKSSEPTDS